MNDDRDDQIRSSIDRLNRMEDQSYFHETQAATSKAVSEAILSKDDFKARLALGISSSAAAEDESTSAFEECTADLRSAWRLSEFLPSSVTDEWIARLAQMDVDQPLHALDTLRELAGDYERAIERVAPKRDIFNVAIHEEMRLLDERMKTQRALRRLRTTLTRVMDEKIGGALKKLRLTPD